MRAAGVALPWALHAWGSLHSCSMRSAHMTCMRLKPERQATAHPRSTASAYSTYELALRVQLGQKARKAHRTTQCEQAGSRLVAHQPAPRRPPAAPLQLPHNLRPRPQDRQGVSKPSPVGLLKKKNTVLAAASWLHGRRRAAQARACTWITGGHRPAGGGLQRSTMATCRPPVPALCSASGAAVPARCACSCICQRVS